MTVTKNFSYSLEGKVAQVKILVGFSGKKESDNVAGTKGGKCDYSKHRSYFCCCWANWRNFSLASGSLCSIRRAVSSINR